MGISEFLSHSDPFGYIWIGAHLASKLETGVICLLESACLWFRVHGFLIELELAKLSTDSLRLKLNRKEWVLVQGSNDQFSLRSRKRCGSVLDFRVFGRKI